MTSPAEDQGGHSAKVRWSARPSSTCSITASSVRGLWWRSSR